MAELSVPMACHLILFSVHSRALVMFHYGFQHFLPNCGYPLHKFCFWHPLIRKQSYWSVILIRRQTLITKLWKCEEKKKKIPELMKQNSSFDCHCDPVRQETWVQSLGWEAPLEKGVAAHSSILAGKIQWTEEPNGLQSMELQKSQTWLRDWADEREDISLQAKLLF